MKTLAFFFGGIATCATLYFAAMGIARQTGDQQGKAAAQAFRKSFEPTPEQIETNRISSNQELRSLARRALDQCEVSKNPLDPAWLEQIQKVIESSKDGVAANSPETQEVSQLETRLKNLKSGVRTDVKQIPEP